MRFGAAIPVLNEWRFLPAVVGQLLKVCDHVLILRGKRSLSGAPVDLSPIPRLDSRAWIVEEDWASEHETRNAGMELLSVGKRACDYVFTIDSDEILSVDALRTLQIGCEKGPPALFCRFDTYWKTPEYKIEPPGDTIAPVIVRSDVRFQRLRMLEAIEGQTHTLINKPLVHHLSYVRSDDEMKEKLRLFGHASEVVPDWYERVWLGWDENPDMEDLHPTHPPVFKRAVRQVNPELLGILRQHGVS